MKSHERSKRVVRIMLISEKHFFWYEKNWLKKAVKWDQCFEYDDIEFRQDVEIYGLGRKIRIKGRCQMPRQADLVRN